MVNKIKSFLRPEKIIDEKVDMANYERLDKLIESRIKKTYILLTIVCGYILFIFQLWSHTIDAYKTQFFGNNSNMLPPIVLYSLMLSYGIINMFLILESIFLDHKLVQPLVDINKRDVFKANEIHLSAISTIKNSIIVVGFMFIVISMYWVTICLSVINYGYAILLIGLLIYSILRIIQFYKHSQRLLIIQRHVLVFLLAIFILMTALNMCGLCIINPTQNTVYNAPIGLSDGIQIVLVIIEVMITIYIAILQIKQGNRMEKLERGVLKRDDMRHNDTVQTTATNFLIKYHKELDLLPLCLMANMYNRTLPYNRKIYVAFNSLSTEVQDFILQKQEIKLPRYNGDFYDYCYCSVKKYLDSKYPQQYKGHYLYDYGKYFYRTIENYANNPSLINNMKYTNSLTDDLSGRNGHKISFEDILMKKINNNTNDEKKFCDTLSIALYYVATYGTRENQDNCGLLKLLPGNGKIQYKMEDVFLMALLSIYIQKIVNSKQ